MDLWVYAFRVRKMTCNPHYILDTSNYKLRWIFSHLPFLGDLATDDDPSWATDARATMKQRDRYKGSKESLGKETDALDPDEHFGVIALMLGPPASCCVCFIFSMYTLKFVYEKLQHTTCTNLIRTTAFLFRQDPVFSQIAISYKKCRQCKHVMLSELRRTITYGIGWLLCDWNNGILLRKNQHERIHKIWFDFDFWCFNATFNSISAISWRPVLVVEEAGENHRPWASNW